MLSMRMNGPFERVLLGRYIETRFIILLVMTKHGI